MADFERLRMTAKTVRSHTIMLEAKHPGCHVRLRPMSEDDWPDLLRWNADPCVVYYSEGSIDDLHTPDEIKEIYRVTSQSAYCFMIECDGILVGECWLQKMNIKEIVDTNSGKDCRRIDIMIGEKGHWNRGIGTAVIKALVDFGFGDQHADKIFGLVSDYNTRSRRTFEKAGFGLVGTRKESAGSKGQYELQMCITREENLRSKARS